MIDEKRDSKFLITVSAMVILIIATLVSMVIIFTFVVDTTRAIALAGIISGVTVPASVGLGLWIKTDQSERRIQDVAIKVDGRLEQLLTQTARSNEAEGHSAGLAEGRVAGIKESLALEAARLETPPQPKEEQKPTS